jgi:hypothetical protein
MVQHTVCSDSAYLVTMATGGSLFAIVVRTKGEVVVDSRPARDEVRHSDDEVQKFCKRSMAMLSQHQDLKDNGKT